MQDSLARLDDALIDRVFQRAVDRITRHVATDCFRLACVGTDLSALAWILSRAGDIAEAARSGAPLDVGFQSALLILGLGAMTVLRTPFQRAGGAAGGRGRLNPLRAGMQIHRLICLFWLVGLAVKAAWAPAGLEPMALLAMGLSATVAVYVGACSNPPPRRREQRVGNWGRRAPALLGG